MYKFIDVIKRLILGMVLIGGPTCLIVLCLIVACCQAIFKTEPDPLDVGNVYMFNQALTRDIVDERGNGFTIVYRSTVMTKDRLMEVLSHKNIDENLDSLRGVVLERFDGDLLDVDIYDFAEVVKYFEIDPKLWVNRILVCGKERKLRYFNPNPNLPDGVTEYDFRTDQGILWIDNRDIFSVSTNDNKIYRYWKVSGPREISDTDEHFTHFTSEQKVKP